MQYTFEGFVFQFTTSPLDPTQVVGITSPDIGGLGAQGISFQPGIPLVVAQAVAQGLVRAETGN